KTRRGMARRRNWVTAAAALALTAGAVTAAASQAHGAASAAGTPASRADGQATDYFGVTHTSEPNYIAATSGDTWWVNNDKDWSQGNQYDHTNIVDELEAARIPWDAYMEAMPSAGYLGAQWPAAGGALYASKHNPFILY